MKVKYQVCGCGEDIYENNQFCVGCGQPADPSRWKEEDVPDIDGKETPKQVKFKQWLCDVKFLTYAHNNQPAIVLVDHHTGERIATATSCLDIDLADNHTLIKDYNENEGMAEALEKAGIIKLTGLSVPSGYVELLEAEILADMG